MMGVCGSKKALLGRSNDQQQEDGQQEDGQQQKQEQQEPQEPREQQQQQQEQEQQEQQEPNVPSASGSGVGIPRQKSLKEQQRRRLSVSVTAVEASDSAANGGAAAADAANCNTPGAGQKGSKNPVDPSARGDSRPPGSSHSHEDESSRGSSKPAPAAVAAAAADNAAVVMKPLPGRGNCASAAAGESAAAAGAAGAAAEGSCSSSAKGFCPELPPVFAALPFAPEEAWQHIDDVTAQFLLRHFTSDDDTGDRCAVLGFPARERQHGFDNKQMDCVVSADEDCDNFDSFQSQIGVGCSCKKGLKPESPNQDDFSFIRCSAFGVYGVFDGHGPNGHQASDFVHRVLPLMLLSHPNLRNDLPAALSGAFHATHKCLLDFCSHDKEVDSSLSGTTATLVLHERKRLTVAYVGDSRCVLAKRDSKGGIVASFCTVDHKPTNPEEKKRIEAAGGEVMRLDCDIPHRVFLKDHLFPGLAMSRAIGDAIAHQIGVVSEPEILQVPLDSDCLFFIVASDGVWEFITSEDAVDIVSRYVTGAPDDSERMKDAAERLAYEAFRRWIDEEGNVVDDVTVIVVWVGG